MKLSFVSFYSDVNAYGVRLLCAQAKQAGFDTHILFVPTHEANIRLKDVDYRSGVDERTLEVAVDFLKDFDIVALSLMSAYHYTAERLVNMLKPKFSGLIISGGPHVTLFPEMVEPYSDIIVIGEADEVFPKILERLKDSKSLEDIPNVRYGFPKIKKTENLSLPFKIEPPPCNLDMSPIPDFSLENNWIIETHKLLPLDFDIFKRRSRNIVIDGKTKYGYRTITTRGCVHNCKYCTEPAIRRKTGERRAVRSRSVNHVISEIKQVRRVLPFIESITFMDDDFFARPLDEIEKFSTAYKSEVGLPFICIGYPSSITKTKLDALVDAGCVKFSIGVQTGSERMAQIYNRPIDFGRVVEISRLISSYKNVQPTAYDIIVGAPYETEDDRWQTVKLLKSLAKPFHINLYKFEPYLGSELAEKMISEKILTKEQAFSAYQDPIGKIESNTPASMVLKVFFETNSFFWLSFLAMAKPILRLVKAKALIRLVENLAIYSVRVVRKLKELFS